MDGANHKTAKLLNELALECCSGPDGVDPKAFSELLAAAKPYLQAAACRSLCGQRRCWFKREPCEELRDVMQDLSVGVYTLLLKEGPTPWGREFFFGFRTKISSVLTDRWRKQERTIKTVSISEMVEEFEADKTEGLQSWEDVIVYAAMRYGVGNIPGTVLLQVCDAMG
jgi:hypothetical protein